MPGLYRTAEEKRHLETRNGAIQFLAVLAYIDEWQGQPKLTPGVLEELQRLAVNQIYTCAGQFRDGAVQIAGVVHQPPDHTAVRTLVEEMCGYIHDRWDSATAVHLAAFVMWRLNWIHPFFGGNGRTSRAASYLVLCAKLGFKVPGSPTIPELIDTTSRDAYYSALQAADRSWSATAEPDLREMESLLESLLAAQLLSVYRQATGGHQEPIPPTG